MRLAASNVTVVIIPNSGHWVMEEQPEATTSALLKFSEWGRRKPVTPHRIQQDRARLYRVALLALLFPLGAATAQSSPDRDWPSVDHDLARTRFTPLKQITAQNVAQVGQAGSYSFPEKEPAQTAPIVVSGAMCLTAAHYTVAFDGSDCRVLWTFRVAAARV